MQPYSHYMGLKIIHEQMVEEAQKRNHFASEVQGAHRQSWLQNIRAFLARLRVAPARKAEIVTVPGCD
jgi:truncated hemoglobin YjbI